jgi:hypothetical protein
MLSSVGLVSNWSTSDKNFVTAKASYFKYSQVPTSVSTDSIVNGNTSSDTRISETERSFKYDYYGIDADLYFKRRLYKSTYLVGGGSFVENQGAPKGVNQGYRAGGGAGMEVIPNHELELSAYTYKIESDAVLAAYANSDFFYVNRNGMEMIAAWKSVKQNFRVSFYYNDSRLIVENPALSDGKMYILRFEVLNVDI